MNCLIVTVDVYLVIHPICVSVRTLTFDVRSQN